MRKIILTVIATITVIAGLVYGAWCYFLHLLTTGETEEFARLTEDD